MPHGKQQRRSGEGATKADRFVEAELHGNGIGSLEPDPANFAGQAIGILGHDLDRISAVGLVTIGLLFPLGLYGFFEHWFPANQVSTML